jgi:pimeloyl-ACP methyl ester carboxylesterase
MSRANAFILPGLLEDADVFDAVAAVLDDVAEFTAADLTRSDSIVQMARDALEQAPPGPLNLVAHSMGGYVALEILRTAPGRVAKLALLNTNARPDSPESSANRRRLVELAERDFEAACMALLPRLMTAGHLEDPVLTGAIGAMAHATGLEAFKRQQAAIIGRADSRPSLARIACPTLVVAARDDAIMPIEWLQELAAGVPGARLAIVEDCGHVSPLEAPEAVAKLLRDWLAA